MFIFPSIYLAKSSISYFKARQWVMSLNDLNFAIIIIIIKHQLNPWFEYFSRKIKYL